MPYDDDAAAQGLLTARIALEHAELLLLMMFRLLSVSLGLLALLSSTSASPLSDQSPLIARETIEEAAAHARHLIEHRGDGIGTLVSTYAANDSSALEHDIAGRPTGLLEYYAPAR